MTSCSTRDFPREAGSPSGVVFDFAVDGGINPGDSVPNALGLSIVAEKLQGILEASSGARFELLEVRLRNHKKKLLPAPFFIANLLDVIACVDEISRQERLLAIALLLAEADSDGFFRHLTLSGEAHLQLLKKMREDGHVSRFAGTGHFHPLCDALAAGQDELARQIAHLAPEQWLTGEGYEEDFVYGRFIQLLLLDGVQPSARQAALLERMKALDPEPDPRQRLCQSFFGRDDEAFEAALVDEIRAHQRHCEELAAARFSPSAQGKTERYILSKDWQCCAWRETQDSRPGESIC